MSRRKYILNQVFVGYPWRRIRPMFEKRIELLHRYYPIHFRAVGRGHAQTSTDLFEEIKRQIERSSGAIFDVTGGNANVALEFGYAEALALDVVLTVNVRRSPGGRRRRDEPSSAIISDLRGKRMNLYRSQRVLDTILLRYTQAHPYVRRFESVCKAHLSPHGKRVLLYIIRMFDDREVIRRDEVVERLISQFPTAKKKVEGSKKRGYKWVDRLPELLRNNKLISITRGRYSQVSIESPA